MDIGIDLVHAEDPGWGNFHQQFLSFHTDGEWLGQVESGAYLICPAELDALLAAEPLVFGLAFHLCRARYHSEFEH